MRQARFGVRVAVGLVVFALSAGVATPVPALALPPSLSVTTSPVGANGIRIEWTVSGGDPSNLLYVYSDNTKVADPGFLPQRCGGGRRPDRATPPDGDEPEPRAEARGRFVRALSR